MKNTTFNTAAVSALLVSPVITKQNISEIQESTHSSKVDLLQFERTQFGTAEMLKAYCGKDWKRNETTKEWMEWTGVVWKENTKGISQQYKSMLDLLMEQFTAQHPSFEVEDKDEQKQISSFLKFFHSASSLGYKNDVLNLLAEMPNQYSLESDYDANPYLIATKNCVIDLKTCEPIAPERDFMMAKQLNFDYDPTATCPQWINFIDTITCGDKDLAKYLQILTGYCLTGDTSEQSIYFLIGRANNGKTIFQKVLSSFLGVYHTTSDKRLFQDKDNSHLDIAELKGARLSNIMELPQGFHMCNNNLKRVADTLTLKARKNRQDYFEFTLQAKIIISSNHKPRIDGSDGGVARRVKIIPFLYSVPKDKVDKHLDEKLNSEHSGILNWALEGCRLWQTIGLVSPEAVIEATKAYLAEEDILGLFINDCLDLSEEKEAIAAKDLFRAYQNWASESGIRYPLSMAQLKKSLCERGFVQKRLSSGMFWVGVSFSGVYPTHAN